MTALSVNLNKVALLRNQRDVGYPSVIRAARAVVAAGAHGITVHPRPDERHITRADVAELKALIRNELPAHVEYNIEGYPSDDWVELVLSAGPHQATLVPDAPDARTSDAGWDLDRSADALRPRIAKLRDAGIRVSLFIEADPAAPAKAAALGAEAVELYTGPYAHAFGTPDGQSVLAAHVATAVAARSAGLRVNAGHDLNLDNLGPYLRAIPFVTEVSIGHAITADALWMGWDETVRAYLRLTGA